MRDSAKSFTSDMDGMQSKLNSLNKTKATLKVDVDRAKADLKAAEWHDGRISKNMTADLEREGHPKRMPAAAAKNAFRILSFLTFVWYNSSKEKT